MQQQPGGSAPPPNPPTETPTSTAPEESGFPFAPKAFHLDDDRSEIEVGFVVPKETHRQALADATPEQLAAILRLRLAPKRETKARIDTDTYPLVTGDYRIEGNRLLLRPHEPLLAGRTYAVQSQPQNLPVEQKPDATGMERWFTVPAEPLRFEQWTIQIPAAETTDPLVAKLDEQSEPLTAESLEVIQPQRWQILPGEATWDEEEHLWQFTPTEPWPAGNWQLQPFSGGGKPPRDRFPFTVTEQPQTIAPPADDDAVAE